MLSFKTYIFKTHRFLGALLSLLFVLWCISGLVLIYHPYPKYTAQERLQHRAPLPAELPTREELGQLLHTRGLDTLPLSSLLLRSSEAPDPQPYLHAASHEDPSADIPWRGDSLPTLSIDSSYLRSIAQRWGKDFVRIDTLTALDQWTPFDHLRPELPFYRLLLQGEDGHEVYVSSHSGAVLQESTRAERLWAWCGAITHWIYLTFIRSHTELWRWVVIVLGALGTFMTLSGFYIGITQYRLRKKRKVQQLFSPYPKRRYQWHHFFGTVSGLMLIAWILTGLLSVVPRPSSLPQELPSWHLSGKPLPISSYQTDLRALRASEGELRELSFRSFGSIPTLVAEGASKPHFYDGRSSTPRLLQLDSAEILSELRQVFGEKHRYTTTWLQQYDSDYIHRAGKLPLPVWRIAIDNEEHYTFYVDPSSGEYRMIGQSERIGAWMFSKLHRLQFPWLVNHPPYWTLTMWSLLLLSLVTSLTGLWMTKDYLRRWWRKRR